jgi:hypothetical protein
MRRILTAVLVGLVAWAAFTAFASSLPVESDQLTVFVVPPPPIPEELVDDLDGEESDVPAAVGQGAIDPCGRSDRPTSSGCVDAQGERGP